MKKFFKSWKIIRIGCFLVTTLLVPHTLTAQKTTFSIYSNIKYSILTVNDLKLTYFLPYSPNIGRDGKFWHNKYERYSKGDLGFGLGANLGYKLQKGFSLMLGLEVNNNTFDIYTTLSGFSVSFGSVDFYPISSMYVENNQINGYLPTDPKGLTLNGIIIDENGIPIVITNQEDYYKYQLEETYKMIYLTVPVLLGYSVNPKIDLNLGAKMSFLLRSVNDTSYPYVDDRVIVNNISSAENFYIVASVAATYNLSNKFGISFSFDKGLTNSISLNDKYAQKGNHKNNTIITGLAFRI